jgi:hypothetical protein
MDRKEIDDALHDAIIKGEWFLSEGYYSNYLGSFMSLDPCGKYHHILSPNGATQECVDFWDTLNELAEEKGMWIEGGEGDPTDIYLCTAVKD